MKYSNNKDIASLVRDLIGDGWQYRNGRRHGRLISPNGISMPVPDTPSDRRATQNFRHDVRRLISHSVIS